MQVSGIEIRLDWSLLIIFMLVVVNFGVGVLPRWHPSWPAASVWALAVLRLLRLAAGPRAVATRATARCRCDGTSR
jgi:hypothetical protein